MIDIEDRLGLDERAAIDFVLKLRTRWADSVYPSLKAEVDRAGADVEDLDAATAAIHRAPVYPWFSHLERAQQKLLWKTVGDAVLDRRDELVAFLDVTPAVGVGSLVLDDSLELPDWYTDYDIHVQPGNFHSHDLSAFVYEMGARIVMLRDNDGFKFHTLFAQTALPDKDDATRVVDLGCGFGKSTRPLVARYPKAEVIGIDLAAPGLRLAHAEAEELGLAIHYRQADAQNTGIEAGTCDVVTGTMTLHEMPTTAIVNVIKEAARLLKPGGSLHFLEFAPTGDLVRDATVYEHAERNNEPYFRHLFATDGVAAATEAGLVSASWTPFDERSLGLSPEGYGERPEWHFPWAVFSATKEASA